MTESILIGTKPFMNYVTAVVMQFVSKDEKTVILKARGKFISRCVDVAEAVEKRFLPELVKIESMKTDSEEFTSNEGRRVRVSTLEITLISTQ